MRKAFWAVAVCFLCAGSAHAEDSYPTRAANDEVEGVATIECTVQPDGALADCLVLNEKPVGYGFGAATVKLFVRVFNTQKHPEMAQPHEPGDRVKFTYHWKLG
jgi:protein TonB